MFAFYQILSFLPYGNNLILIIKIRLKNFHFSSGFLCHFYHKIIEIKV